MGSINGPWQDKDKAKSFCYLNCLWHIIAMNYEIDKIPPEDEGDGLPHMVWRLRIRPAAVLSNSVVWAGVILLIR